MISPISLIIHFVESESNSIIRRHTYIPFNSMSTDPPNRVSNMDYPNPNPNPKAFPLLSYVMSRLPSLRHAPPHSDHDIESPHPHSPQPPPLISRMPRLDDPKVIAAMSAAVEEIAETRSVLQALGARPDHETVDFARVKLAEIESSEIFSDQLEEIALSPENEAERAEDKRAAVREREKMVYKAIIQLDEMHEAYEKLLRDEEEKLSKIYDKEVKVSENVKGKEKVFGDEGDEVDEEIVRVLMEGDEIQEVDLEGRKLRILPEAFGRLSKIVVLNLSSNQLQALPDSIGGLSNLEEFNLSSNSLQSLPDSIGMLNKKLRILNVSGNKLTALPDSICYCRSLEGLDAGFNNLGYLPTNIGELFNLVKLSVEYNKIRSLPTSIGEMKSLQYLDIRFNELHTIPLTFGKLTNLVTLNLSGNFSDLKELPETFGELMNLEEVDLSNNQIHALPDSFGRLDKLKKLNLEQNPIAIPPVEALNDGIETVKIFMAKRWADRLMEEEKKSRKEMQVDTEIGWLKRSVSKLGAVVSNVSEYLGSPRSPRDEVLNLQR